MEDDTTQNNKDINDLMDEEYILNTEYDPEVNPLDENNIEDYKEKVRRSGVIYISRIPEGMTVANIREHLTDYGVTRIYFIPDREKRLTEFNNKKVRCYKEGWIEFENKLMAKLCEYELNGKRIGGKRNVLYREDLWTLKYLKKFKWNHLMEKLSFDKKLREQRLKADMAQSKRENNFLVKNFEKSKMLNKKKKRMENETTPTETQTQTTQEDKTQDDLKQFRKNYKQRKPIIKNNI